MNRTTGGSCDKDYCCKCKAGDIIEMYLDFEVMGLRYTINGKDYGQAFDIDHGEYRAAVCLHKDMGEIELLRQ